MPTLQKKIQMHSVIFAQKNTKRVYILTQGYRMWHQHLEKLLHVYNLQDTKLHDGKKPNKR